MEARTDRLYRLLEDAGRRVKEWPEWKRSEDSKRELERLADERLHAQKGAKESK